MPIFTIRTPRGDEVDIDAPDEATAIRGAQRWDYEDFATAEAQAAGLNPDLVLRQMQKESAGDHGAVSPKGARGLMQLMPETAAELGVNPDDPYDNIRGGVRYLKQQFDAFGGDERLALAAYNAGPGAVRKHGGVPPFAETRDYVDTLAGGPASEAPAPAPPARGRYANALTGELLNPAQSAALDALAAAGKLNPSAENVGTAAFPRVMQSAEDQPEPGSWYITLDGQVKQAPERATSQALGFLRGVADPLARTEDRLTQQRPFSPFNLASPSGGMLQALALPARYLLGQAEQKLDKAEATGLAPGKAGKFAGNLALSAMIPGGPVTSGMMSGAMLSEHDDAAGLIGDTLFGGVGGKLGDLFVSGLASGVRALTGKSPSTMTTAALKKAKDAAYQAVDNEGVRFARSGFRDLVEGITDDLADVDADVTPKVAAVLRNIQGRAGQEPTLSELDKLRQYVRLNIGGRTADDAERRYASKIIANIDEFISAKFPRTVAGDGDRGARAIKQARELNARLKKVEAIESAVEEAQYRTAKTGTGGNLENVLRQELDKVRKKQPGLKPDEKTALDAIIKGDKVQDALRLFGRLSPTTGGLSAMLNTGAAGASGGATVPISAAGFASKTLADLQTKRKINALLKLFASGGTKAAVEKKMPPGAERVLREAEKLRPIVSRAAATGAVVSTQ